MSLELSTRAEIISAKKDVKPNLILEIDGYSTIFAAITPQKIPLFDDGLYFDDGLFFDQYGVPYANSKDYISLSGSTTNLDQQLNQYSSSSQSVSRFTVELVDKNGEITELVSPGFTFNDIIGQKANLYLSFEGLNHPEDSILIHYGPIDGVSYLPGLIRLDIAGSEQQKRQKIFIKSTCKLEAAAFNEGANIQDLTYQKKDYVSGTVSITYNAGASLGSETISVSTNAITLTIASNATTAGKIKQLIEDDAQAKQLVDVTITGTRSNPQTSQALTNLATTSTLTVDSTEGFIVPGDAIKSYLVIGDEIMRYTGLTETTFTGVTRAELGSTGQNHQIGDEISSFYRLEDAPIDLALKLMLSPSTDSDSVSILSFLHEEGGSDVAGSIWFNDFDVQFNYGLNVGDFITVTNATTNNMTLEPIIGFGKSGVLSYVLVGATVTYMASTGNAVFKSQFDVLNEGLGMKMTDVDVERHLYYRDTFSTAFPDVDFYLKDTIDGKEFISKLYQSIGLYTLPRKTSASVGMSLPPIADQVVPDIDSAIVYSTKDIVQSRNVNKNFYNAVVYKYEVDSVSDKYFKGLITYSADSQTRIPTFGNKPLEIISDGLRDNVSTNTLIESLSTRILDRYQFAAEMYSNVKVLFSEGFKIEIGDVVYFGDTSMKMVDVSTGNRQFVKRLMEVVNKRLNIKTGEISLDLLSTNFNLNGRYATIAPSSIIGSGSTTTSIVITDSYNTTAVAGRIENYKWQEFVGMPIKVHSVDFSTNEQVTLLRIDPTDDYKLITTALSSPPTAGMIVTAPIYNDGSLETDETWKVRHCFLNPTLSVVSGSSSTVFTVSAGDYAKLIVGAYIKLHKQDFSSVSPEVRVLTKGGSNTITVDTDLGFTPSSDYIINLVGFIDSGLPYRVI